ncbi:MAG: S-methyl-5-thioribose-1-phosphate isomerase [Kiritimatiellae bacterium]|nr:S-methyl-5-thioribose-1-phosphate isomerase [Kiritimatiellia bacterium]
MTDVRPPCAVRWLDGSGCVHRKRGASARVPGCLDIIDQARLPDELVRLHLSAPREIHDAIRRLSVRGAPAIGCAAALGLAACAQRFGVSDATDYLVKLRATADYLDSARPTAVNLHWALARCLAKVVPASIPEMDARLLDEALDILDEDIRMCDAIGGHGLGLLRTGMGVLTHCNAGALATGGCGTALAPIYAAHAAGYDIKVFSNETRPLLQGARLTAWELSECGIDVTTICDSMAAQVMREGRIHIVIVGADRVAANGDTANKIGTYPLAISAKYHGVPFYVAMPYSTIDRSLPDGAGIPIEQRPDCEIAHCRGARVYNPAFDVTPRALITGYITERGVLDHV